MANGTALWPVTRRVMSLGRPSRLVAPSTPAPPARALLRLVPLSPLLSLSHNVFLGLLLPYYDAWWCGPDTWACPRQLAARRGPQSSLGTWGSGRQALRRRLWSPMGVSFLGCGVSNDRIFP